MQVDVVKGCAVSNHFQIQCFHLAVERTIIQSFLVNRLPAFHIDHSPTENPVLQPVVNAHCRWYDGASDIETNEEIHHRDKLPKAFLVRVMLIYMRKSSNMGKRLISF